MGTIMQSKENRMLEIFFNYPTKHWHFEEMLKKTKISRDKANGWLKRFMKEGLVKRIKERGKMPYYIADHESPAYKNKKKLFALQQFYDSGFLNHLQSLSKAKTVIIFGSMARSDWYHGSDVDLFVYGDVKQGEIGSYYKGLHREIQVFIAKNRSDMKKFAEGLLSNILEGHLIKGEFETLGVDINV